MKAVLKACDTILFLCSGNIIRSAFAEIYSKYIQIDKEILSAGTSYFNKQITEEAKEELLGLNVPNNIIAEFSPTHISQLDLTKYTNIIVIGMKQHHLDEFQYDNILGKYLLSEIDEVKKDIADPYFEGGFAEVFSEIKGYVDKLKKLSMNDNFFNNLT